jgi:hypothetical protein
MHAFLCGKCSWQRRSPLTGGLIPLYSAPFFVLFMINKMLIVGKIPPPTGGVTVHVFRLLENLRNRGFFYYRFQNLAEVSASEIMLEIFRHKAVHLHTSSTFLQLVISLYCRLINRKLIVTYHGNWGRYRLIKNAAAGLSARLSSIPVVLNQDSLIQARNWNQNSMMLPAYIPYVAREQFPEIVLTKLLCYKSKYKFLISTNASNLSFDKYGNEIYGISELVSKICMEPSCALIVSDPSGSYQRHFMTFPENIFFVTEPHDFVDLLVLSDAFIRNTTTDGDSISIHEAISLNLPVFASDCVPRPAACRLFKNISEVNLSEQLERMTAERCAAPEKMPDVTNELIKIYSRCLAFHA